MKKMLFMLILGCYFNAKAQVSEHHHAYDLPGYYKTVPLSLRSVRNAPYLNTIPAAGFFSSATYWQATSYNTYSGNGRIRTSHSFDVQGQLRESKASVSLRRTGILSYWRIQISPQRQRPQFIYVIH
jgi:hypothetical protein